MGQVLSWSYLLQYSEEVIVSVLVNLAAFAETARLAELFGLGQKALFLFSAIRRGIRHC